MIAGRCAGRARKEVRWEAELVGFGRFEAELVGEVGLVGRSPGRQAGLRPNWSV